MQLTVCPIAVASHMIVIRGGVPPGVSPHVTSTPPIIIARLTCESWIKALLEVTTHRLSVNSASSSLVELALEVQRVLSLLVAGGKGIGASRGASCVVALKECSLATWRERRALT